MTLKNESLLIEVSEEAKKNPCILRIFLTPTYTRIDFGYTTPWYYEKGGWITISPDTYLKLRGNAQKFTLKEAVGIPLSPQRMNFESTEDWQYFSLYFEPIPKQDCIVDLVEAEDEDPTLNAWNISGISIQLNQGVVVYV